MRQQFHLQVREISKFKNSILDACQKGLHKVFSTENEYEEEVELEVVET